MSAEGAPPLSTSISAQQLKGSPPEQRTTQDLMDNGDWYKLPAPTDQGSTTTAGASFGSPAVASPPVKQTLDFDLGGSRLKQEPVTPSTPPAVGLHSSTIKSADDGTDTDYSQFVTDVLLWTNVVRSIFYLVIGAALILLVDYLVDHDVPLITIICQLTLVQMALNFIRHVISPSLQQKATWLDSAWTHSAINSVGTSLKTIAALHDKHLSATSPHKHLLIALALWATSLACTWISPTHLALALYIGAFIVPKVYVLNRKHIEPKANEAFGTAKAKFESADRRIKAAVIMALILALGCISTTNFIIAVFVICLFASSQLPKEVELLSQKAAPVLTPLGNTAANVGGHISNAVNTAVNKYELTPTPLKKKKL